MKVILFVVFIQTSNAQTTQFFQSFESTSPENWNYVISPTTYNTEGDLIVDGSEDVWAVIEEFTNDIDNPSEGNLFFGAQDINNPNGGGALYHTITFDAIDTSNLTNMTLSFDYFSKGYDSSDHIKYEILTNNTTPFADNSTNDALVGGIDLNKGTVNWTTINTAIPDGTSFVRLRIKAYQNGSSDFLGIDNIKLIGDSTLSIATFNKGLFLKLYPNPTSSFIKIKGLTETTAYNIYNMLGAKVKKGIISDNKKIGIQNLTNGFYFLKFKNGSTIKFLKK